MELDGSAAPERPASPDRGRLNLLQSACISLAASRAAGTPAENGQHGSMERPERGSPAAATAADAAPGNESADADVFFEYDVESGAAGSASGGAADTGCAMTSPAGGSRDLSPVPLPSPDNSAAVAANADAANANVNANASNSVPVDVVVAVDVAAAIADGEPIDAASDSAHAACIAVRPDAGAGGADGAAADHSACPAEAACAAGAAAAAAVADGAAAAAEPSGGDCQLARSEAVPVPGGGRCAGDYARSADRPSALLHNGRRRAMGGSLPQQSPSEKVDAWLRACREDSGTSTEDEEEAERAAAAESATAAAAAAVAAAAEAEAEVEAAAAKVAEPEPEEPQFQLDGDRASELEDSSETEEMADALGVSDVHDLRVLMARGLQMLELEDAPAAPPAADGDGGEGEQQGAGAGGGEQPRRWIGARPRYREDHGRAAEGSGVGGGAEGGAADAAADPGADVTIEAAIEAAEPDADDEAASTSGASSSFAPPDQLKRSTSLKSGKTPPQTPGRKKFVRFADAMGLDLQRVHTFRDEIPTVPAAAFRGLDMDARAPSPTPPAPDTFQMSFGSAALSAGVSGAPLRQLVPMFLQPGGSLGFLDRLRRDRVVLENVTCNNDDYTVNGVVRVLNMDFHKTVYVRYTLDEWRTSPELRAEYVSGSCDGLSDRFRVSLPAGALQPGERLQFVVRFECQGQVYWDNNGNENYVVQMIRSASASSMEEFGDWSGGRL